MDILLLAGSNAGLRDGWAAQFMELAQDHRVKNRFLGAVGSLFGLLRLLHLDRDLSGQPDLIIFEYALNDAIMLGDCGLSAAMLRDTLDEVAQYCAERQIRLLFLALQPRDARAGFFSSSPRVLRSYSRVAKARAMRPCLTLNEILGGRPDAGCYQDAYHLTQPVSRKVAERLLSLVGEEEIPVPLAAPRRPCAFSYVGAEAAAALGPVSTEAHESKVFSGRFLKIERSGSSRWPGRGRLAGLMLRSSGRAGIYVVGNAAKAYRKCSASLMQQTVANLILLHYVSHRLHVDDDLVIAMPGQPSAVFALENDGSMQEAAPNASFFEQCLEINGVMLWRPAPLWARLQAAAALWAARLRLRRSGARRAPVESCAQ
ncbi:SGNH/GDSL hydrolase family protein [Methylocystis heyeri]|uniref:Uncharacterized protein n=1 Tax=Methylocystis heyeri TaxID=391905 RepID=A0A6B8KCR3_9HYPH|nr:SGNH/GDSL hydrolase family protein [Methylocystis heyeri]QGM44230.1 hypothetical protein H2LOC_000090 [Methylocystis heyeri]